MTDIVDRLEAIASLLSELEPWQTNERQVGMLCGEAAEEISCLRQIIHEIEIQRVA